jgi:hypothetical protein
MRSTVRPFPRVVLAGVVLASLFALAAFVLSPTGTASPGAQAAEAPKNTVAPTIAGTAREATTLTADEGTWTGDQPMVFTYAWQRCNTSGANCVAIPNATQKTYGLQSADVGNTIRVTVAAANASGTRSATSNHTVPIEKAAPSEPEGAKKLANGQTSIPVTSVSQPQRLVIDRVEFSPNPVRSRTAPITVRVKVLDTRGYVVRGALVFVRSTPVVTNTPAEQQTAEDGWATFTVAPQADFPLRPGYSVQFFARARKEGENSLAGVSTRRLVQVATSRVL